MPEYFEAIRFVIKVAFSLLIIAELLLFIPYGQRLFRIIRR